MEEYEEMKFQLILNPIRDWNIDIKHILTVLTRFQLILNPIRDWNKARLIAALIKISFQLILNPIRDWNVTALFSGSFFKNVPINLKPY